MIKIAVITGFKLTNGLYEMNITTAVLKELEQKRRKWNKKSKKGTNKVEITREFKFKDERVLSNWREYTIEGESVDKHAKVASDDETVDSMIENEFDFNIESQVSKYNLRDREKLTRPRKFDSYATLWEGNATYYSNKALAPEQLWQRATDVGRRRYYKTECSIKDVLGIDGTHEK